MSLYLSINYKLNNLMKKKLRLLLVVSTLLLSSATTAFSEPPVLDDPVTRSEQIEKRVLEIWKMDFSEMEKSEKLILREELKSFKKELKSKGLDDKVSISIGAIIIILLVIIIIS